MRQQAVGSQSLKKQKVLPPCDGYFSISAAAGVVLPCLHPSHHGLFVRQTAHPFNHTTNRQMRRMRAPLGVLLACAGLAGAFVPASVRPRTGAFLLITSGTGVNKGHGMTAAVRDAGIPTSHLMNLGVVKVDLDASVPSPD